MRMLQLLSTQVILKLNPQNVIADWLAWLYLTAIHPIEIIRSKGNPMDLFRRYLEEYVKEAIENSNGANAGISEYLWAKKDPGRFASNKEIRIKALREARWAFDEHRHWPLSIILGLLGFENKEELMNKKAS